MPVSFFRTPADYLGINEAPQKPLFQQTNALQQGADDAMGFFNQMVGLRQQRPLAQAQAIQNQYSTIFNNAEKLRLEQQAAKEAEQAVSALAGLTPEVDDYVAQRQEIQRQFPNAMLDPRVQRIVDDNDRMFSSRQGAIAKQQNEAADRRAKLFGMGATPQQVEAVFQNPDAAAQLEFQLGKGTSGKGNAATLKSAVDLLNDEIKAMSEAGEDYEMVGEQQVMKPEYKALLDRRNKYRDAYLGELDKTVFPQQAETVAKEVETPVVPPATITPQAKPKAPPVEQTINLDAVPLNEIEDTIKKTKEESEVAASRQQIWNKAQMDLEKSLEKVFPGNYEGTNYAKLRRIAKAIVDDERIPDPSPQKAYDESGAPVTISVVEDVLSKIGKPIKSEAFVEPGTGRKVFFGLIGDQRVPYDELLKVWADNYLKRSNVTVAPNQAAISAEMNNAIEDVLK